MTDSKRIPTKNIILSGMFTALICVLSQIIIPIQPVPFSLSILAIFLTGSLLTPGYAFLSALAYILLGAFGLPVFAGFKGGPQVLAGMTGGFIMAYPVMSFITSVSYKISKKLTYKLTCELTDESSDTDSDDSYFKNTDKFKLTRTIICIILPLLGMTASLFICYVIGTIWFCYVGGSGITYAISVCVLPFIAFDFIKLFIILAITPVIKNAFARVLQ